MAGRASRRRARGRSVQRHSDDESADTFRPSQRRVSLTHSSTRCLEVALFSTAVSLYHKLVKDYPRPQLIVGLQYWINPKKNNDWFAKVFAMRISEHSKRRRRDFCKYTELVLKTLNVIFFQNYKQKVVLFC